MNQRIGFFLAILFACTLSFGQTRMPAGQVSVDANEFGTFVLEEATAQEALDWVDANWGVWTNGDIEISNLVTILQANFDLVSNDFQVVQEVVNNNANIIYSNAVAHNMNWQHVLPGFFDEVFEGVDGWNRTNFEASLWAAYTNTSWLEAGSLGNYFSLTNWTHGIVDPVSNTLASVMFDGAYISYWGYTTNGNNRTLTTNEYIATNGVADYVFSFPTNSAGSYATVNSGGPFTLDVGETGVDGVVIDEPGRYQVNVQLRLSDITPFYSATNSAVEGTFLYTLRWYDGDTPGSWWRALGRLVPPSTQPWLPDDLDVAGSGPADYYESGIFYTDTFLVTADDLEDYGGAITLRVLAGYAPATLGSNAYHMVRAASMTVLRTATW